MCWFRNGKIRFGRAKWIYQDYPCFLRLWNRRRNDQHWKIRNWPYRVTLVIGINDACSSFLKVVQNFLGKVGKLQANSERYV